MSANRVLLNHALTIRQPWAWAVIHGGKDVENRSWHTSYRGTLYIHSALAGTTEADRHHADISQAIDAQREAGLSVELKFGYVLGTVELAGIHHANDCRDSNTNMLCSPWALPGNYHWQLTEPRPLTCPFPEQGKQGLWRF
ncbi:ASCH domain-containing protein [Pseudarthrobacter sp. J64]|uniref:ASCH domain-containing protein n=1 Tax=Pseudarthrobacter sp. J64 TaxID=3116485 RepID=UPI002E80CE47|nr:ASCH domain-containing protein [Pseudarthrobacter sp. J64]MEE2568588.1 ASCH domain-containing protein [Pseudarthrobacter sp. J64]